MVLAVEEDGVQRLGEGVLRGPLQKMVVSRDGKWLASFTHDGRLLVTTSDLTGVIIERDCEVWIENETVLFVVRIIASFGVVL